ncbi:unnamed protein product [Boreogadus saida]
MVDGVQMVHFDSVSKKTVLKQDWMEQLTRDHPDYLERSNGLSLGSQQTFKANIGILKQRFNQTGAWRGGGGSTGPQQQQDSGLRKKIIKV